MEPLFTTTTTVTLDEYMKYSERISLKSKRFVGMLIITTVLLLLLSLVAFLNKSYTKAMVCVIVGMLYPVVSMVYSRIDMKRVYNRDALIHDALCKFSFFAQHMVGEGLTDCLEYTYDRLYSIVETETNFYIMIAKDQGWIVVKQNCTPELIAFIQEIKQKYGK